MKKLYMKPELHYEDFSLTESIAACVITAQQGNPTNCAYYDSGFDQLIFTATPSCEQIVESFEVVENLIFGS